MRRGRGAYVQEHPSAGVTHWFIVQGEQKVGPLAAAELVRMMDAGELGWDSQIWREGLPGWTPIRGDQALVTAIAAVRGAFADTHVFAAPAGLLADNTVVDVPPLPPRQSAGAGGGTAAPPAAPPPPLAAQAPEPLPELRVQGRVVGLLRPPYGDTGAHHPVVPRSPVPHSWMPSVRSMLLVAGLAFVFGVVVAAVWGRLFRRAPAREDIVVPTLRLGEVQSAEPPVSGDGPDAATTPLREPEAEPEGALSVEALRGEVRRISSDVHRCLTAPSEGVQVDAVIEAETGRVRDVRVSGARLSAGVHTCIVQAVRQIQVPAFAGGAYKLSHRFVW
jgi:hypothetical protein